MIPFIVGHFCSTPDGVGRLLYFTDYKRPSPDKPSEPTSVVVHFGLTTAGKYPLSLITSATEEEYRAAVQARKNAPNAPQGDFREGEDSKKNAQSGTRQALAEVLP